MLSSQSISDIETPYRIFYDIENTNTDSDTDTDPPGRSIMDVEDEMNTFFLIESKVAWYFFLGFCVSMIIGCVVYFMVI
jgi:hypothetical protein